MKFKHVFTVCAAALLVVAAGTANAGERIASSGYDGCVTDLWDELQLDDGHTVSQYFDRCVTVADNVDPSSGECIGTTEVMPDESWKDSGFCTWTFQDGSKTFLTYYQDSDMAGCRYDYFGGTGKYAGAGGGGTCSGDFVTETMGAFPFKEVLELP